MICGLIEWIPKYLYTHELEPDSSYRVDYTRTTLYNGEMRDVTSAHPHTMTSASWSSREEARDERLQQQTPLPLLGNKAPAPVCNGRTLAVDLLQVNKSDRSCISADLSSCLSRFFPNHSLLFCSHRFCFSYLLRSLKQHYEYSFFPLWGLFLALAIVLGDESLLVMQY